MNANFETIDDGHGGQQNKQHKSRRDNWPETGGARSVVPFTACPLLAEDIFVSLS
jgi:hypothetical protein